MLILIIILIASLWVILKTENFVFFNIAFVILALTLIGIIIVDANKGCEVKELAESLKDSECRYFKLKILEKLE